MIKKYFTELFQEIRDMYDPFDIEEHEELTLEELKEELAYELNSHDKGLREIAISITVLGLCGFLLHFNKATDFIDLPLIRLLNYLPNEFFLAFVELRTSFIEVGLIGWVYDRQSRRGKKEQNRRLKIIYSAISKKQREQSN